MKLSKNLKRELLTQLSLVSSGIEDHNLSILDLLLQLLCFFFLDSVYFSLNAVRIVLVYGLSTNLCLLVSFEFEILLLCGTERRLVRIELLLVFIDH